MNGKRIGMAACGIAMAVAAAAATGAQTEEPLGEPFMDPATGLVFRPPAGCVFFGKPRTGQIGRFINADRSVSLTVSVEELSSRPQMRAHLERTVQIVTTRLEGMRMAGQTVFRLGAWPAGQWAATSGSGRTAASHVQLLVHAQPRRMFLFTVRCAGLDTARPLAIMRAVRASISLTDPEELAEKRTEALLAAKEVLAQAAERLARLELPEQRWMLLKREGQEIGFTGQRVEPCRIDGRPGFRLVLRAYSDLAGQVTLVDRTVETLADLSVERWRQEVTTQAGAGSPVESPAVQTGLAEGGQMTVVHRQGRRRIAQHGDVPEGYAGIVVTEMFRRLVDPTDARVYTFSHYDVDACRTLPITFRAVGPTKAPADGGEGFCFQQLLGNGLSPTKIWTDAFGRDLRYEAAGGITAVRTDAGEVRRRWAALGELRVLETTDDAPPEPSEQP